MNLTSINQQAYSSPTATHLAVGFRSLKRHGASAPFGLCAFFMQKINGGCAWEILWGLPVSVIRSSNLCTSITQCFEAFRDGLNKLFTEAHMPHTPKNHPTAMDDYSPASKISVAFESVQCLRVMLCHEVEADHTQLSIEQILSHVEVVEFAMRNALISLEE